MFHPDDEAFERRAANEDGGNQPVILTPEQLEEVQQEYRQYMQKYWAIKEYQIAQYFAELKAEQMDDAVRLKIGGEVGPDGRTE